MALHPISRIFVLCFIFNLASGHIFTSTARMGKMLEANAVIVSNLEQYIAKEEARVNTLKTLRRDILTLKEIDLGSSLSLVEHPVGAFRVVQAFYRLQREIENSHQWTQEFTGTLKQEGIALPTGVDVDDAYSSILTLQRIYQLKAEDLMNGIVGTRQIAHITATAAIEIGNFADNTTETATMNKQLATEWWEAAIKHDASRRQLTSQTRREVLLKLTRRHMELCRSGKVSAHLNQTIQTCDTELESEQDTRYLMNNSADTTTETPDSSTLYSVEVDIEGETQYSALCRGDPLAIASDPFTSFCILAPGPIPYDPIRVEVMSIDPFIVMFHGAISDNDASEIKAMAFKQLTQGNVSDNPGHEQTWFYDEAPVVGKIATRIKTMTGLDARPNGGDMSAGSEPFHIVNYGIGGYCKAHWDFFLNDVEEGGATVFPYLGIRIPSIKGSAAFWFNLHRSGESDPRTLHAGCPVLLGHKLITNTWIKEYGQEFRHRCGLHVDDIHYQF